MNLINNHHIQIFDDFYSVYGQQIEKLWPELKDVVIDVYDKNSAQLKDYIIKHDVFGDMSENIDSPFQCYPNFQYHNQTINDLIMRDDLCQKATLTKQEHFALIAHEIGHFISAYRNTGLKGQEEEYFADARAKELGLGQELANALRKCMEIIPAPDSNDPFVHMQQQQHESNETMKDKILERIDKL